MTIGAGDCLFGAIVMQLPNILAGQNKYKYAPKNLWLQVVEYMAANHHVLLNEFKPNLE